jgi:hypothetical protein
MTKPILVTGCERDYFLMTAVLMHSLKRCAPGLTLHVLDFGMEERQAQFLARHCRLERRPADVPPGAHSFFYKTQLAGFLRDTAWSSLIWIDSDMMAVGALESAIDALMAQMSDAGAQAAMCRDDSATIDGIIASGLPMQPFLDMIAKRRIARESPYFNTGFIVCRSPALLQAWDALGRATPLHSMFDQNLFNLVLAEHGAPHALPARIWNLHGALLSKTTLQEINGRPTLIAGGERPLLLHPTSPRASEVSAASGLRLGDRQIPGTLKFCGNPALRAVQDFILQDFGATYLDELTRDGIALKIP